MNSRCSRIIAIALIAGLVLLPLGCSFGNSDPDPDCSGHGTWDGQVCQCDQGFDLNPDDPTKCLEQEEVCSGYGQLVDGVCQCEGGYITDPSNPADCIDPGSLECDGHGHVHDGQYCSCDSGWMQDPNDVFSCIEDPDYVCNGHGQLVAGACECDQGYEQVPGDPTACQRVGTQHTDGVAVDVSLSLHEDQVKISMHSLLVSGAATTDYDLYMAHDGPGPNLKLGPNVSAFDLGNGQDYHSVNEAPTDGYLTDVAGAGDYVIGVGFIAGGSGDTGFDMTENVYVLKLADGTFAKVEVLSARAGEVHLLCYHQPDGSSDITTDTTTQQ